jgi:HPt (histidine-containing phosphotransfer) domain-containing protein
MTQALNLSDLRNLKAMIGGDPDDLAELVDDFVAALPDQISQMRAQGACADWVALRISAHSSKSNARDLGAAHLSELCAELESQCASGNVQDLEAQMTKISQSMDATLLNFAKLDLADV